jgi:hypothetical protein
VPAPVEGWDASTALASMKETRAVQLKNWFPQPGYLEVRRGYRRHAFQCGSDAKTISAVDTGTETFTSTAHGKANADVVKVHSSADDLPSGLSSTRVYYIVGATTDTFQLSLTSGGSAVDVTSAGSGTLTVYDVDDPNVETLATWQGPASSKLFAAAGGCFWDVTNTGAAALAKVSGGGSDRWQWCNHTTSAGSFLFLVNGSDDPLHYNGSAWTAPTITGITPADIIGVTSHKKRLWFVMKDSTKAAYLGTEAVAGAATEFQFGSLFSRGGHLLAVAPWTRDGGSGSDDFFVAISSEGQAAVYQGTDPSSANTWALVGVFDVPTPIGRRCVTRFGADLLLITVEGVFPFSQLLAVDQSQVDRIAISQRISGAFNTAAQSYSTYFGWEAMVYPGGTRLIVNVPTAENSASVQYVMNTLTGAWCEYDNHNANTWALYNDQPYFAGSDGSVYRADTGRADRQTAITAVCQTAYSAFGTPKTKRFTMMRPLLTASGNNRPSIGMSLDFVETFSLSTLPSAAATSSSIWDDAIWDSDVWENDTASVADWANLKGLGTFGSIKCTARTGVDVGSSGWGIGLWDTEEFGSGGQVDEAMRIQGFLVLAEVGEYL